MKALDNGKAAGSSGIPEMLKAGRGSEDVVGMLTDLMSAVWKERYLHRNGLVPIPKEAIYTAMIIGGGSLC